MFKKKIVALEQLEDTVLKLHDQYRQAAMNDEDVEFIDFSKEDLMKFVENLWTYRFSNSRDMFQDSVSEAISRRVEKL
jgi:hypothetical protein